MITKKKRKAVTTRTKTMTRKIRKTANKSIIKNIVQKTMCKNAKVI